MGLTRDISSQAARLVLLLALTSTGCAPAAKPVGPAQTPATPPSTAPAADDPIRYSLRVNGGLQIGVLIVPGAVRVEVRDEDAGQRPEATHVYLFPTHPADVRRLKAVMAAYTSVSTADDRLRGDSFSTAIVGEIEVVGHVKLAEALAWREVAEAAWSAGAERAAIVAFGAAARAFREWERSFVRRHIADRGWEPEIPTRTYAIDGQKHAASGPMPDPADWIERYRLSPKIAVELTRRGWVSGGNVMNPADSSMMSSPSSAAAST